MEQSVLMICYETPNSQELQIAFNQSSIHVIQIDRIKNAITLMVEHNPAFVLLDFEMDGAKNFLEEVSRSVFFRPPPYIVITATFSGGSDRATAFNLGADACIEKPILPREAIALVHAVLRREHKMVRLKINRSISRFEHKDMVIDPQRCTVTMRGELVSLTKKEFDILLLLVQHTGIVLTTKTIYKNVWGTDYEFNAARVTDNIYSLRQKLGLDSKDLNYIQTVYRVGYRFAQHE